MEFILLRLLRRIIGRDERELLGRVLPIEVRAIKIEGAECHEKQDDDNSYNRTDARASVMLRRHVAGIDCLLRLNRLRRHTSIIGARCKVQGTRDKASG